MSRPYMVEYVLFLQRLDARNRALFTPRVEFLTFDVARHKCPHCEGAGVEANGPDLDDCPWCEGTGEDPEANA